MSNVAPNADNRIKREYLVLDSQRRLVRDDAWRGRVFVTREYADGAMVDYWRTPIDHTKKRGPQ